MSSQERIEANRLNAQQSTGPVTAEGKAKAGRNALKHGLLSKEVVLPTEDRAEFEAFRDGMVADLRPGGVLEETLAERVAGQWWRLKRVARMESALVERDLGEMDEGAMPLPVLGEGHVPSEAVAPGSEPGHALPPQRRKGMAPENAAGGRPDGRAVRARVYDTDGGALAASLGAKYCPYDTLRRYERAIERGLDSTMRQFREAQELRAEREAAQAREDRDQEQREEQARSSPDLRSRLDSALDELRDVRALAKSAGVDVGRSPLLEEWFGWPSDEDEGRDSEIAAAVRLASQRVAEVAPRPAANAPRPTAETQSAADVSELQRYGCDKGE